MTQPAIEITDEDQVVEERPIEELIEEACGRGGLVPGQFYDDIPGALYHRGPGISKSGLDKLDQSPAHYMTEKEHPKPSTPALFFGSALHCLVLEPDVFEREYIADNDERLLPLAVPGDAPARPQARSVNAKNPRPEVLEAAAWWENFDQLREDHRARVEDEVGDRIVISTKVGKDPFWDMSDWDRLHRMREAVYQHPIAGLLLDSFIPERTCYWMKRAEFNLEPGAPMLERHELAKCRPDAIGIAHGNLLMDLKSTEDASLSAFGRSCAKFRYHVQDSWYREGARACGIEPSGFVFIAVEKAPPFGVGVYAITDQWRALGATLAQRNFDAYARAIEEGFWPTYPPEVRPLELPPFAQRIDIR